MAVDFDGFLDRLAQRAESIPVCPECGPVTTTMTRGLKSREVRTTCPHQREESALAAIEEAREREAKERSAAAWRFHKTWGPLPEDFAGLLLAGVDSRPSSAAGRAAAEKYLATWTERKAGGQGLIFTGDVGTGKTMVAAALLGELGRRGEFVLYHTTTNLQAKLRDFDRAAERMENYKSAALLMLDDFGQEKTTEWFAAQLFDLLDSRCQDKRPTILTTNLGAQGLEDHYVRCLMNGKDRMPEDQAVLTVQRIISRIKQRNVTVVFEGEDQRLLATPNWLEQGE